MTTIRTAPVVVKTLEELGYACKEAGLTLVPQPAPVALAAKPRIHTREANIAETATGWLWREQGRTFGTATAALDAVNRDGKLLAGDSAVSAYIITWHYATNAGRLVASALCKRP